MTANAQHTPGPWRVESRGKYNIRISGPRWGAFAKVVVRMEGDREDSETGHANARLIAAAPCLLTALRDVLPYAVAAIGLPRQNWPTDSVILQAEAAIAKATGGAS